MLRMDLFTVFIFSLFLTIALVPLLKRVAVKVHLVDLPNARKVHSVPMPKAGGISMAFGVFIPMLLWLPKSDFINSIILGALIIVVFGVVDDIRPLSPWQKLLPQAAAALCVILLGGVRITSLGELFPLVQELPFPVSLGLTLVVILGITNAVNLSDGLDGLAGGISILSFIMIVFLAHQSRNRDIAVMAVAMVGGIAGFLRYNTHPAVLFMGDAGSQLLGFLSIVFALALTQANTPYARVLSLTLIGFPILDTLVVMGERMLRKRSPFKADKNHFHHRLLSLGFFHTESVLAIYLIQSCFIVFALVFRFYSDWVHVLGFMALACLVLPPVFLARARAWQFRRDGVFDTRIKRRLRVLKERHLVIRTVFGCLKYGFPLVLACQVLAPASIPSPLGWAAAILSLAVAGACATGFAKARVYLLRFAVYLAFPLVLYLGESDPGPWTAGIPALVNNGAFMALACLMVLTLNLTRRQQGFKVTPMDILMVIVILVLPNLPSMPFSQGFAGMALAKALVMFFGFDLIVSEQRGETLGLAKTCAAILALLALRGVVA